MKLVLALVRLVGAVLLLAPIVLGYAAGATLQALVSSWKAGRSETRRMIEDA